MSEASHATLELIERARAGDAEAMDVLLRRYREYVRLLVRRQASGRMQSRVDSSDLIQETLLRAAQNIQQFRGSSEQEWRGWLRRIAAHEVVRQRRHHLGVEKRAASREQSDVAGGESLLLRWFNKTQTSPSLAAMRKEGALHLADALAALPDDYREILILRHLEELEFQDAALRMGRTSGAVRVLWTRALRKLRDVLQQRAAVE